jgi:hypothetical protein
VDSVRAFEAVLLDVEGVVLPKGEVIEIEVFIVNGVVAKVGSGLLTSSVAEGLAHTRLDVSIVNIAVA